uniref:Antimicrobial-peptide n=1 Tax=Alligator sinensis TaxID=38654 RepID=A0A2H4ZLD2_ALLSI|nr:antimicrobial-peptide [Alligator sinensis]
MRILYLLFAAAMILFLQAVPAKGSYYSTLQCRSNHGHCRRLCFHGERWIGNCNGGHQHCCK